MAWRKTINGGNTLEGITLISAVLLVFSFYQQTFWLMFLGGLLLVLSRMSIYYLNHAADSLEFENNRETIRLSEGEETTVNIVLSQLSRLPIFQATLQVRLENVVEGVGIPSLHSESNVELMIPIQLKGNDTIHIPLQLKAMRRGVTRIKSLELIIPNFFGFGSVELTYQPYIQKELIIHPTSIAVPQTDQLVATKLQGNYATPTSMYEQILAPIGTRDYVFTDSFQRIHWKASAKTQNLQTKIYERTAHHSWTFIINLREPNTPNYHMGVVENIESIASNVAYMAQVATKKGIDYEVFLNIRTASQGAVYHIPIGNGTHQLGRVLDSLARVQRNGNTLPINKLLRYVDKQQQNSPVVIACGPYEEEGYLHLAQMQKKGQRVYLLHDDVEYPAIIPLSRS
ncbi:DUF58 domain-containing protein [Bacillus sp. CGMCC 1.16607]|uniref:DUF58 domain-containing protein n=1 Tax=Bacillus sp. CGMCC 1.16607 TaxID=3351842 RepID=UPI003628E6B2